MIGLHSRLGRDFCLHSPFSPKLRMGAQIIFCDSIFAIIIAPHYDACTAGVLSGCTVVGGAGTMLGVDLIASLF